MSFFDLQEDATGNTWVTVGPPYSQTHAAVHWLAGAKLEMPDIPETCGRELRVDPESPRSPNGDGPHILSRVDGGEWVIPAESSAPVFRFREGGKHLCELRALLPSGEALPDSVEFEVEAEVPLPETALGGQGPFLVDSLTWEPPVSALPSGPGEEPRLEYRIDEGPWREMTQEGAVSFVGSATGDHEIEVTAVEEGFWRDPTPVILEVEYDLDFEKVVESAMERLLSTDRPDVSSLVDDLAAAGPGVLPVLRERIHHQQNLQSEISVLQRLAQQIRDESRR